MKRVIAEASILGSWFLVFVSFLAVPIGILMLGIGFNPAEGPGPLGWWTLALIPVWLIGCAGAIEFAAWTKHKLRWWLE